MRKSMDMVPMLRVRLETWRDNLEDDSSELIFSEVHLMPILPRLGELLDFPGLDNYLVVKEIVHVVGDDEIDVVLGVEPA